MVIGSIGITLDIEHLEDLDAWVQFEDFLVALLALVEVGLTGVGEEDDVTLSVQFADYTLAAEVAGLKIVGADEEKPVAVRRVGVDGDDGNVLVDGGVDFRLEESGI